MSNKIINHIRAQIINAAFILTHKFKSEDFVRTRKLTFQIVFILLLKKSVKSLQNVLNELVMSNNMTYEATASALSQAKQKLKHTAFIELNNDIVSMHYKEEKIKRFKGYRVIAFDGSEIILPKSKNIENEFGSSKVKNSSGKELDNYVHARSEICYDVLNKIVVGATLGHGKSDEIKMASDMLSTFKNDDLLIFDRLYCAYIIMAKMLNKNLNFVIRCPKKRFKETDEMFEKGGAWTKIVTLTPSRERLKEAKSLGLPEEIKVRLVRVVLSTGEVEVLITSLLDETYEQNTYKELYFLRWGIETYIGTIKGRLNLENFTGKSAESVRQDFWSTIFISNLETILVQGAQKKSNKGKKEDHAEIVINRAVSFNVIKNFAFELFFGDGNSDDTTKEMETLFLTGQVARRPDRKSERKQVTPIRSRNYNKRTRKHVY